MSWIKNLCETYDRNLQHIGDTSDSVPLLPLCHTIQNAHIQIVIDANGIFLRANVVQKENAPTIIPCTEASGSRAGKKPKGHPLCDSLQFVAGDFVKFGGIVTSGYSRDPQYPYNEFIVGLENWCSSKNKNSKVVSIFNYVKKCTVVADLFAAGVLHRGEDNLLLKNFTKEQLKNHFGSSEKIPEIFNLIQPSQDDKTIDQGGSFIRWCVETPGMPLSEVWNDSTIWESWATFYAEQETISGLCYVLGSNERLTKTHPKRIRRGNDNAKLISLPSDKSFLTFQGRFTDDDGVQAIGVSSEATQKAHNALRWLVGRKQAFRNGDQAIVSWAVTGENVPELLSNTFDLFIDENEKTEMSEPIQSDVGQGFAQRLNKYIAGYSAMLGSTNRIAVLGLDSASPGRLSITFYRELTGSDFLGRIEKWHSDLAWKQRITIEDETAKKKKQKILWPICAPAPKDIAQAAYGMRLDDKLKKATVERLLPSIVDGLSIPRDLVYATFRRACNRVGLDYWEWEKTLGIACSLYKGYYLRNPQDTRSYSMALETDRTTRDYLYGRLLSVAEHIETLAINVGGERRDTTASKLMQRFADRPFSTWKTIELALTPYKTRLQAKRPGYLYLKKELLDKIHSLFLPGDYETDKPLSGEFLLGYHCQRDSLNSYVEKTDSNLDAEIEVITETK